MSSAQELAEGWREIKEQKQDLSSLFQDMEQQLLSLSRRPAELETKIAQNMLTQAKVRAADPTYIHVYCMSTCALDLDSTVHIIQHVGSGYVGIQERSSSALDA